MWLEDKNTGPELSSESSSQPPNPMLNILLGGIAKTPQTSGGLTASSRTALSPGSPAVSTSSGRDNSSNTSVKEVSLFEQGFHPTQGPQIKTLGLAEGLLPSEELITHYWAAERQREGTAFPKVTRMSAGPLKSLWERMTLKD